MSLDDEIEFWESAAQRAKPEQDGLFLLCIGIYIGLKIAKEKSDDDKTAH